MCIDCNERLTRRAFLTSATATLAGVSLAADGAGEQPAIQNALDDKNIIQGAITFQSGADTIKGYLARPKRVGRFSAVVISHGNPGISDDIKNVAAQVAQAGFAGLAVDWGERAPMPVSQQDRDEWVRHVTSYTFVKLQMQDLQAGIDHLYAQSFIKRKGAAVIGFCGG
ncbi:MAG TPA: dienelactone hydrolase family protein, partial [Blastocatellia bacterium]|nr:dienelactone hydrolase family protein [Blastocatellia bacterium]